MKWLALLFVFAVTFREWVGEKTRNDSWGWVAENVPWERGMGWAKMLSWERGMGWAKMLSWERGMGFLRRFAAVPEEKREDG